MDRLIIIIVTLFIVLTQIIDKNGATPLSRRSPQCTENEFECREDHECISKGWVCDYSYDCSDRSDEEGCSKGEETTLSSDKKPCTEGEFECVSDGVCIPSSWVCDKGLDCFDKSDEKNCFSGECLADEIRCKETGHCIKINWLCDGDKDCLDGSDESDCPQVPSTTQLYFKTTSDNEEEGSNNTTELNIISHNISYYLNNTNETESNSSYSVDLEFAEPSTNLTDPSHNLTFILDLENVVEFGLNPSSNADLDYFLPVDSNQNISGLLFETEIVYSGDGSVENIDSTNVSYKDDDTSSTTSRTFLTEMIHNDLTVSDSQSTIFTENPDITLSTEGETIYLRSTDSYTDSNDMLLNDSLASEVLADTSTFATTTLETSTDFTSTPNITSTIISTTEETPTPTITAEITTSPTTTTITISPEITTTTTTTTTNTTPAPCNHGEFFCRADGKCIPVEWRCDHTKDCWDGSDEENCDEVKCPAHMVQCPDTGQCIFYAWICDGANDCDTGSDERHCHLH